MIRSKAYEDQNYNIRKQGVLKIKVILVTNKSTVTDTMKRKGRTWRKCIVLKSVNFEDDKISINGTPICTSLNSPHYFLPEVSGQVSSISCVKSVYKTVFF